MTAEDGGRAADAACAGHRRETYGEEHAKVAIRLDNLAGLLRAIGVIDGDNVELRFLRWPFQREPDFGATSVNNELSALLALAEEPA